MKKVLLSLTLFMASFFFVTLNKVSAASVTQEITADVMSWINEDFYTFRNKVIEHCIENNSYYVIIRSVSSDSTYYVYIFPSIEDFYFSAQVPPLYLRLCFSNYDSYKFENNDLVYVASSNTVTSTTFYNKNEGHIYYILDSNFDLNYNKTYSIDYIYKDLTYSVTSGTVFPTLYKIYLDENPLPTDPFEEDKEILNNFYTTIFTKISDLANNFANNYIFLLILGIFVLIFVFELIWRRFM